MIEIKIPIYHGTLLIIPNTDTYKEKGLKRFLRRYYRDTKFKGKEAKQRIAYFTQTMQEFIHDSSLDGITMSRGGLYIVSLKTYKHYPADMGILVHELAHVVFELLRGVGMVETSESTEAYTYLLGYLTEHAFEGLREIIEIAKDDKQ